MAGQYSGGCWETWGPPQKANWAERSDHLLEGGPPPQVCVSFSLRQTGMCLPEGSVPGGSWDGPALLQAPGPVSRLLKSWEDTGLYLCDRREEGTGPFKGQGQESAVDEDGDARKLLPSPSARAQLLLREDNFSSAPAGLPGSGGLTVTGTW